MGTERIDVLAVGNSVDFNRQAVYKGCLIDWWVGGFTVVSIRSDGSILAKAKIPKQGIGRRVSAPAEWFRNAALARVGGA